MNTNRMSILIETLKYYKGPIHEEKKAKMLLQKILDHKKKCRCKVDFKGYVLSDVIIEILEKHTIDLYILFDLFFVKKKGIRGLTFKKVISQWSRKRPYQVIVLCKLYGAKYIKLVDGTILVEVPK